MKSEFEVIEIKPSKFRELFKISFLGGTLRVNVIKLSVLNPFRKRVFKTIIAPGIYCYGHTIRRRLFSRPVTTPPRSIVYDGSVITDPVTFTIPGTDQSCTVRVVD